jgi:hypothetical protein
LAWKCIEHLPPFLKTKSFPQYSSSSDQISS